MLDSYLDTVEIGRLLRQPPATPPPAPVVAARFVNRVVYTPTNATNVLVRWTTDSPDLTGVEYPGPGDYIDTEDYVIETIIRGGGDMSAIVSSIPIQNSVVMSLGLVAARSLTVSGRCAVANGVGDANGNVLGVVRVGGTGDIAGSVLAEIVTAGEVEVPGAGFGVGPVYLGATGALTQTPLSGSGDLVLRIGWAVGAEIMIVHVGEGIVV